VATPALRLVAVVCPTLTRRLLRTITGRDGRSCRGSRSRQPKRVCDRHQATLSELVRCGRFASYVATLAHHAKRESEYGVDSTQRGAGAVGWAPSDAPPLSRSASRCCCAHSPPRNAPATSLSRRSLSAAASPRSKRSTDCSSRTPSTTSCGSRSSAPSLHRRRDRRPGSPMWRAQRRRPCRHRARARRRQRRWAPRLRDAVPRGQPVAAISQARTRASSGCSPSIPRRGGAASVSSWCGHHRGGPERGRRARGDPSPTGMTDAHRLCERLGFTRAPACGWTPVARRPAARLGAGVVERSHRCARVQWPAMIAARRRQGSLTTFRVMVRWRILQR
jgi:hypothetical protein